MEVVQLSPDQIISRLPVRKLSPSGVARLRESMQHSGFLDNYPLIVAPLGNDTYHLIEGNHRLEAALSLDIRMLPSITKDHLTQGEQFKLALQCNAAAEAMVPSTLVTYAEFIWARSSKGEYTQEKIAEILGWSRDKVAKYDALKGICEDAWKVIVTTFEDNALGSEEGGVTTIVTPVTFTENLLRSILDLTAEQQMELVQELATNKDFSKGKFKTRAENYRTRNEMKDYALEKLGKLGEPYTMQLLEEVYSGAYDADWKNVAHPKLHKLIEAIRDEWERKNSMYLIHGDFSEQVQLLPEESVDLILTDPPYNIASDQEFIYEGRSNVSQDFGEWDKHNHQEFIDHFTEWACEWFRILRPQGSGYVFTSDRYLSRLREALEQIGLHIKATIVWHKTNPGTQAVKTNFKSSVEYILFFTKGEGGHTFNWLSDNGSVMHNFIESEICSGKERLVDAKGKTLHPTQKPEKILSHFTEISSNRGDTVFDGFMGVGSTGKVAKDLGRKFIGIEQDKSFFEAARRRLVE